MDADKDSRARPPMPIDPDELRRRAEGSSDGAAASMLEPEDAATLLHELNVHQIELEMQNEELRAVHFDLDRQREKYFELFDQAPSGYLTSDGEGIVTEANLTAANLLGVKREELVGHAVRDFVVPEDQDDLYLLMRALDATGAPQSHEMGLQRNTGSGPTEDTIAFPALVHAQPGDPSSGTSLGARIAFTDITQLRQARAAALARHEIAEYAQEHSLDETIQRAMDAIEVATDSKMGFFHFVDDDQESLQLQTWSTATLASECTAAGRGTHYPVSEAGVWANCLREGRPLIHNDYMSLPNRRGLPSGHVPIVRELTVPVLRGGKVRVVLGVGNKPVDYTDADLDLVVQLADLTVDLVLAKRADEEMRDAQALLQAIADGTSDAVFVKDLEGRYLLFNKAGAAVTGKSPEEVLGHDDTFIFPAQEAAAVMEGDRAVMAGGVVKTYEERVTTQDGLTVYSSTKGPVLAPDGSVRGIFGISRDTTQQAVVEAALRASEGRLRDALEQVSAAFDSSIELLAQVVETRDPYTAGHERRVSELSVRIAQEMGMSEDDVEEIRIAALIHDVGKISVPAEILSKPGALATMEFELIKAHSVAGYNILTAARFAEPIAEIVYQHHERCDGSGYPRGLVADQILRSAKIIMVADVVEAMSSHRPYRAALGIDVARKEVERGAGREYDAAVAEACGRVLDAGFEFTEYKLSETGVRGRPPRKGTGLRSVI